MLLLIDAGNSCLKWNLASSASRQLIDTTHFVNWQSETALNDMFEQWAQHKDITQVLMSSVVNNVRNNLISQWVKALWNKDVEFIQTQAQAKGVLNAYTDPTQLGVDRWLGLIASYVLYNILYPGKHIIFIDCGTAITIDIVSPSGMHKGGVIFPGIYLMQNSLTANTNIKIPLSDDWDFDIYNQQTATAIQNGVVNTIVAGINSIVHKVSQDCSQNVLNIISGGDAKKLIPNLADKYYYEPDMVLKGLRLMADEVS